MLGPSCRRWLRRAWACGLFWRRQAPCTPCPACCSQARHPLPSQLLLPVKSHHTVLPMALFWIDFRHPAYMDTCLRATVRSHSSGHHDSHAELSRPALTWLSDWDLAKGATLRHAGNVQQQAACMGALQALAYCPAEGLAISDAIAGSGCLPTIITILQSGPLPLRPLAAGALCNLLLNNAAVAVRAKN